MTSLDWLIAIGLTVFVLCSLAGMVKFVQALGVLRRGQPEIDEELKQEQEDNFQNNEEDN